jgi:hypothetical protein
MTPAGRDSLRIHSHTQKNAAPSTFLVLPCSRLPAPICLPVPCQVRAALVRVRAERWEGRIGGVAARGGHGSGIG